MVEAHRLSQRERDTTPSEHFAVPGKRKLPIGDATHVSDAWREVGVTEGLTDSERSEARARIKSRAKELGVDTTHWTASEEPGVGALVAVALQAMSLEVPSTPGHPNKRPFSGVLTFLDQPSDGPVGGTNGRCTILPSAVAEKAIPTLVGMAVDMDPHLDSHNETHKVGVISGAQVVGNELRIEGFLYARDFPKDMQRIDANRGKLGFSYELTPTAATITAEGHFRIDDGYFTGAAILLADKAAYQSTSLAAARQKETTTMDEAAFAALKTTVEGLAASVASITEQLKPLGAANTCMAAVEPHAAALERTADGMEAAGVGTETKNGHVVHLRFMASSMRAEAAMGKMPSAYYHFQAAAAPAAAASTENVVDPQLTAALKTLTDGLASVTTQLADLKAAKRVESPEPTRKTLTPAVNALLAKRGISGLTASEDGGIDIMALDAALGKTQMTPEERIAFKRSLERAQAGQTA